MMIERGMGTGRHGGGDGDGDGKANESSISHSCKETSDLKGISQHKSSKSSCELISLQYQQ